MTELNRTKNLTVRQTAELLGVNVNTIYAWTSGVNSAPAGLPKSTYENGRLCFDCNEIEQFALSYKKHRAAKPETKAAASENQPKFTKKELEEALFKYLDGLTGDDACFDDKDKAFLSMIKKLIKGDCEFPSVMDTKASVEFMLVNILDYYKSDYQDTNALLDVMTTVTNLIRKSGANK